MFAAWVAKRLVIPQDAVERSLRPIDDKHFRTINLIWKETERADLEKWRFRGRWTAEMAEHQFPPSSYGMSEPLGSGYPTFLVYVAVDRRDRPVWFGSSSDFRIVEVPPTADGKIGFSLSALGYAQRVIDVPTDVRAVALRVYMPVRCAEAGTCLERSGTVRLPGHAPVLP